MAETKPAGSSPRQLTKADIALGLRPQDINKHPKEVKAPERDREVVAYIEGTNHMLDVVLERRGLIRPAKMSDGDAFGPGSEVIGEKYRSGSHAPDVFKANDYHAAHPEDILPWPFSVENFEFHVGAGKTFIFCDEKNRTQAVGIVGAGSLGVGPTFGINRGDIGKPIPVRDVTDIKLLPEDKILQDTVASFIKADGPITTEQPPVEVQTIPETKLQSAKPSRWERVRSVLSQPQQPQGEVK
ncbi:MAG: hypothetical protein ABSE17_03070 [Candidatus Levyibacteriota bacterium]|jgi:hypothetical protein